VLTPGPNGVKGSIAKAEELLRETPNGYMLQQFNNSANPRISPGDDRNTRGQEDVKKSTTKCGPSSALKKIALGCPISVRWGGGIHFASS
jgi:cysteine synthase